MLQNDPAVGFDLRSRPSQEELALSGGEMAELVDQALEESISMVSLIVDIAGFDIAYLDP